MTPATIRANVRALERMQRALEHEEERQERRSHRLTQQLLRLQAQCPHPNLEEDRDAWNTTYRCPDCGMSWMNQLPPEVRARNVRARYEALTREEHQLRERLAHAKTKRAARRIAERIKTVFRLREALHRVCPHLRTYDGQSWDGPYGGCEDCRWSW